MSKLLVIKAHPLTAEKSRSVAIHDTFLEAYKVANPSDTVTVIDAYQDYIPEIDQFLLETWADAASQKELTTEQVTALTRFNELTQQFLDTDKIVITNALWNLNIPTRLKAWIDTVMVSGKSFKYTENGPVGLVSGKKLLHIQSNGGHYNGQEPASQYIESIFKFMGVDDIAHIFIEGVDYEPDRADEIIGAAKDKATELAKTF